MSPTEPDVRPQQSSGNDAAHGARRLLLSRTNGILSTLSRKLAGYPFGSVAPFCLDGDGRPVVLISTIAEHTRNLAADSRASLIVTERDEGDVQAVGRVTLVGDFTRIENAEPRTETRYYRYFPASRGYHKTHDFDFYRMDVKKIRYIGGFGAIHWFEPDDILAANPFTAEQETSMVNHMNEDHAENMREMVHGLFGVQPESASMVALDRTGFLVKTTGPDDLHHFSFGREVDGAGLRGAVVDVLQRARFKRDGGSA